MRKTRARAASAVKDDDTSSEAATDTSDSCSIADSDSSFDEEPVAASSPKTKLVKKLSSPQQLAPRREATSSNKPAKWVCVGYGRYVKVQE
ncbi:Syntaxin 7 protein [Phytophthora cinnamomi]|uniref:Syntaxin 7 protein n=1 Tax=Phytophthora cinnamomi TaxID=4785 RepID=UPI003559719E|nr:Syntaxin 7 protein [Phytophthora cinnamomi]